MVFERDHISSCLGWIVVFQGNGMSSVACKGVGNVPETSVLLQLKLKECMLDSTIGY